MYTFLCTLYWINCEALQMMQLVTYLKTTFQLHASWQLCFLHLQRHPYPLCFTVNFDKQKTYWQAAQGRCPWHWHTASVCIPTTQAVSVSPTPTCGVFGFITVTLNTVSNKGSSATVQAMRAYGGNKVQQYSFSTSPICERVWSISRPGQKPLYTLKQDP
jgi:hypothetical protein